MSHTSKNIFLSSVGPKCLNLVSMILQPFSLTSSNITFENSVLSPHIIRPCLLRISSSQDLTLYRKFMENVANFIQVHYDQLQYVLLHRLVRTSKLTKNHTMIITTLLPHSSQ